MGVTGHRDLVQTARLVDVLGGIREIVPSSPATPTRLGVVSALAEGADRAVVQAAFAEAAGRGDEVRLEVVLPFDRARYAELQGLSAGSAAEFRAWIDCATSVLELDGSTEPKELEASYESAGRYIVNRCDVLLAVWDGEPSRGRGGTAEILLYAATLGKPCFWLPTNPELRCSDNLGDRAQSFVEAVRQRALVPEQSQGTSLRLHTDAVESLKDTFRRLDAFNRSPLPSERKLRSRLSVEIVLADETSRWVAGPLIRAIVLADRYRMRFASATWLMAALATAAAICLGASVALHHPSLSWAWGDVGCLLALLAVFVSTRRLGLHARWLSYRLLAERFRSAFFIAPTGVDFRRTAGLETFFVARPSTEWPLRAFEEVWDSRPGARAAPSSPAEEDVEPLKRWLAIDWIGSQIDYYRRAGNRHARQVRLLTASISLFILGATLSAVLHATRTIERPAIFFLITLPVGAAAVGMILTVRQHRALADRCKRMHTDLGSAQRTLLDVDSQTIGKTTSEVARLIAEENGDWFGAMWFLDVEQPP